MRPNFLFKAIAFFSIAFCATFALKSQTALYVATTGNDAAAGTTAAPLKTIQKALDLAKPGTTIQVAAGTYKERLTWKTSGTGLASTQMITLTNVTGASVILDGSSGGTNGTQQSMINVNNMKFLSIKGLNIKNNIMGSAVGILIQGSGNDITVSGCTISEIGWTSWATGKNTVPSTSTHNANPLLVKGSSASALSNITITGNQIFSCCTGTSEALTVTGNVNGFTVSNNTVRDVTNIGIDIAGHYAWANPDKTLMAKNGKVQGNTVYNCLPPKKTDGTYFTTCAGIYVDGGENITLERNKSYGNVVGFSIGCEVTGFTVKGIVMRDNWVYNNYECGLFLGSGTAGSSVDGTSITNNTFYRNYTKGGGAEISFKTNTNSSIKQNIFVPFSNGSVAVGNWETSGTGLVLSNNLYWRNAPDTVNSALWTTGISDASPLKADPKFVNAAAFNLHLATGSPAINKGGATAGTGETDIDNAARVLGGFMDLGADEAQ